MRASSKPPVWGGVLYIATFRGVGSPARSLQRGSFGLWPSAVPIPILTDSGASGSSSGLAEPDARDSQIGFFAEIGAGRTNET